MDNAFAAAPAVGAQFSCGNGPLCCTRRARAVIRFLLDEKKTKKEKRGCEEEKRKAKQDHRLALFLLSSYQARNRRHDEDFHRGTGYESHAFTHSGRHQGKRARQAAELGARSFRSIVADRRPSSPPRPQAETRFRGKQQQHRHCRRPPPSPRRAPPPSAPRPTSSWPVLPRSQRRSPSAPPSSAKALSPSQEELPLPRPFSSPRGSSASSASSPSPSGSTTPGLPWKRGARLLRVYRGREGRAGGFVRPPGALRPRRPERGRRRNSSSSAKDSALRPASPRRGQRRRGRLHGAGSAQGRPEETRRGGGGGSEAKKGF